MENVFINVDNVINKQKFEGYKIERMRVQFVRQLLENEILIPRIKINFKWCTQ